MAGDARAHGDDLGAVEDVQLHRLAARLRHRPGRGAYYVLAGYDAHSADDDRTFAHWLAREVGVATVPVSSFLPVGERSQMVRFAFCKRRETLDAAVERLAGLAVAGRA